MVEFTGIVTLPEIPQGIDRASNVMNLPETILEVGYTGLGNNIVEVLLRFSITFLSAGYPLVLAIALFNFSGIS